MAYQVPVGISTTVTVAASSANLGPGFDCLGLALGCYDTIVATTIPSGLDITVIGEGEGQLPLTEEHRVVQAIRCGTQALGIDLPGLALQCHNRIPHQRGLGSSAAAVVGGLAVANGFATALEKSHLVRRELVQLASEFEGHSDNAAAAVFGGAVVSWVETDHHQRRSYRALPITLHPRLHLFSAIPQVRSSTDETRKLLPEMIAYQDACFNLSRSALLVVGLTQRPEVLFEATEDVLHQQYRVGVQPQTGALLAHLRAHRIPAVLSGAGPSITMMTYQDTLPDELLSYAAQCHFHLHHLEVGKPVSWSVTSS